MRIFAAAILGLHIALLSAAPKNDVQVESADAEAVAVVAQRGDSRSMFDSFQNDGELIKTCIGGISCEFMTVAEAKARADSVTSVQAVKGETDVTRALTPTLAEMARSLETLKAQKAMLESLEASMNALTSASNKGQQLAEATKGQFADTFTKGISQQPPAAPSLTKGSFAPSAPALTKGPAAAPRYAAAPSKGASAAANPLALEAVMCPSTMYELGKTQKLAGEIKSQLDLSNNVNAHLMAEKQRLEAALAASEVLRLKAQEQAQFNAKVASEYKSKSEALGSALASSNAEKEAVKAAKAELEVQLTATQQALSEEKSKNQALTEELNVCNQDKAALNESLAQQTARAEAAESELAETKEKLEEETKARITCEENLAFTQNRLAKTEEDLNKERAAREQVEEELMKTMTELASCQREVRVTAEALSKTQDELQEKTQALARESAAREALQTKLDSTIEELRTTQKDLRDTQRALEDEQNAHAKTQRQLAETQAELEATEAARKTLEEAKQALEDELAETKNQLDTITAERDQLQTTLDATSAALAETNAQKLKCESDLAEQKTVSEALSSQLGDALTMLKMEKDAREQLTATILTVQEASKKVQEEVKKLQVENLGLQAQVEKLRNEQEAALALAAGCPPTYEKFGSSCYKYVREKTQWKMAQEQCMKDSGNLVAIESTEEQVFLTNFLKRYGANDPYSFTSGNKQYNGWKWLGASNNHMGASGAEFWFNEVTKIKPGYDCQALYLQDFLQYGKWVGLPCYSHAPYVCEVALLPPGSTPPANPAEQMAILSMARDAPPYLMSAVRRY